MNNTEMQVCEPWYQREGLSQKQILAVSAENRQSRDSIAIIGGGIASVNLAYQLCKQGCRVSLYCQDKDLAGNASGNTQGALYPMLKADNGLDSQFFLQAYKETLALFSELKLSEKLPFSQCGVCVLAYDEATIKKREQLIQHSKLLNQDSVVFESLEPAHTNAVTGLDLDMTAIYFPEGGWIDAKALTKLLAKKALQTGLLQLHFERQILSLEALNENGFKAWKLHFKQQEPIEHPVVLLANGHKINEIEQCKALPLRAVRGQVSHIKSQGILPKLKSVLCYKGYLTPSSKALANEHLTQYIHHLGASHVHNEVNCDYSELEQETNQANLQRCLSKNQALIDSVDISDMQARVGIRSVSRDHLPFVGQVPDYDKTIQAYQVNNKGLPSAKATGSLAEVPAPVYQGLYMLGGLGSRGLCSASLSAKILVAQLLNKESPVNQDLLNALSPNRMWIRKLLKGRPV